MSDKPAESLLVSSEKECEDLRKEIDEKTKAFLKIDLKSKNKDKVAYKEALEESIKSLGEYALKSNEILNKVNGLKKEDEASSLKDKDFKKRQTNQVKKIIDIQIKIEKTAKKIKQDLEKQKKVDEKEESKKSAAASSSSSTVKNIFGSFKSLNKNDAKTKSQEITAEEKSIKDEQEKHDDDEVEEEDQSGDDDGDEETKTDENPKLNKTKGLLELMAEQKSKSIVPVSKKRPEPVSSLGKMVAEEAKKAKDSKLKQDEELRTKIKQETEDLSDEFESDKEEINEKEKSIAKIYEKHLENKSDEEDEVKEKKNSVIKELVPSILKNKRLGSTSKNVEITTEPKIQEDVKELEEDEIEDDDKNRVYKESEDEDLSEPEEEFKAQERDLYEKEEDVNYEEDYEEGTEFVVVEDYKKEVDEDLDILKDEIVVCVEMCEDPIFIVVKNKNNETGTVPLRNLRLKEKNELIESKPGEKSEDVEQTNKNKKKEKNKTLLESTALKVTNVVPNTFEDSTLGKIVDNKNHSYENCLKPSLTKSNLNFNGFYWDAKENKIRNRLVSIQKIFVIHKCTNIPVPNKDELEILSRSVRICLFDGVSVVGNIHTIRAHVVGKDERTWVFDDEYTDTIQMLDFSEFFLRSNLLADKRSLGILFELSIYCKKKKTGEESELCSGWAHLPFVDQASNYQIVNKSYDLVLNGGSVYDKNIPLDPNVHRNNGAFSEIITKIFKESKIKFNIKEPNNQFIEILNVLPSPLLGSTLAAPFMKFYYEELAINLLLPLVEFGSFDVSTEPIHSQFLKSFSKALENSDILNGARIAFNQTKENMKRDDRNDNTKCRQAFIKIFNEICHPLLYHYSMPDLKLHNHEAIEQRQILINNVVKLIRKQNSIEYLLNDTQRFEPFDIAELRYEILS